LGKKDLYGGNRSKTDQLPPKNGGNKQLTAIWDTNFPRPLFFGQIAFKTLYVGSYMKKTERNGI
jgi:hypothetical protein